MQQSSIPVDLQLIARTNPHHLRPHLETIHWKRFVLRQAAKRYSHPRTVVVEFHWRHGLIEMILDVRGDHRKTVSNVSVRRRQETATEGEYRLRQV